jgi:hypothetical protein
LLTISIKLVEEALLWAMVIAVMTSVLELVCRVKALEVVAAEPGAMVNVTGSVLEALVRVVVTETTGVAV